MNESDNIPVNEILARQKLKDLIRYVWGNKTANRNKKGSVKIPKPKQLDLPLPPTMSISTKDPWSPSDEKRQLEPKPKQLALPFHRKSPIKPGPTIKKKVYPRKDKSPPIEKPKVISTLFSKKIDTSKPPFYQDADEWFKANFVRGRSGITFPRSYTYIGPDLGDPFNYGKSIHGPQTDEEAAKFYSEREKYMEFWNMELLNKIKKKWPDEYAGMNENQSMKLSEIKEIIDEIINEELSEVNHTTDSSGNNIIAQGAPGSVIRFVTEHPEVIKAMREWVKDCQWGDVSDESDIDDMTDEQILRGVQRHYEGGIRAFIQDANSQAEVPVGYKEGVGYVHAKDRAKDPKSIKKKGGGTEHWRIKFQSARDLKKHGNTEMSKIRESIEKNDIPAMAAIYHFKKMDYWTLSRIWEKYQDVNQAALEATALAITNQKDTEVKKTWPNIVSIVKQIFSGQYRSMARELFHMFVKEFQEMSNSPRLKREFVDQQLKETIKELVDEMVDGERLEEVTMPQSKPTPRNTNELWKLIDSMDYGQSISFYNPKNPSPNTTAPWIYIKKLSDGEQSGFNLSVEPRMDAKTQRGVLRGVDNLQSEEDVTEDEVSLALEAVVRNIDILSMYYIETEEPAPKRKPYEGDPDHDLGDYEKFGPDQLTAKDVTESKNMKKNELRSLIKESIEEVQSEMHEYEEQQETLALKRIQAYAHWGAKNAQKHPNELVTLFQRIVKEIDGLVKAHEHGHEVPIKHSSPQKSPLGVTQETVSKTKQLLDQMISQRTKK